MTDLFTTAPPAPLAELLRPESLADVVGQTHLVGEGAPLRLAFEAGKLHSFVLWGPPGVGKTTIARLAARQMNYEFIALSAVTAGVKEIREAAEQAQRVLDYRKRPTVLFLDEVHRLNKAQQDALLPFVESGLFTFIGATTENVGFELNAALLSRAQVYTLKPLSDDDLKALFVRAQQRLSSPAFSEEAQNIVVSLADGDARRFLNLLETLKTAADAAKLRTVTPEFIAKTTGARVRRFDKGGEEFYNQISAFHKSIRGSNPNAALYWLARMLDGGADARYISRRLMVIASEDIGNADPRALEVATSAALAYERVGSPEGDLALAHAAVYLAVAAKSNAVYTAWNAARAFVAADNSREVPLRLRNAPNEVMKQLGYHAGYRYAHDEPDAYAAGEHYFPDGLKEQAWYQPTPRGLEGKIGEKLAHLHAMDDAARKESKTKGRR
jgi:putative ATPase